MPYSFNQRHRVEISFCLRKQHITLSVPNKGLYMWIPIPESKQINPLRMINLTLSLLGFLVLCPKQQQ